MLACIKKITSEILPTMRTRISLHVVDRIVVKLLVLDGIIAKYGEISQMCLCPSYTMLQKTKGFITLVT